MNSSIKSLNETHSNLDLYYIISKPEYQLLSFDTIYEVVDSVYDYYVDKNLIKEVD